NIVTIVATYAWLGSPFVVPSACSKSATLSLTRSLAVEWAEYGIRLNAIAPGMIETEGAFSRLVPPDMKKHVIEQIPLKRFGELQEIAYAAAYLLSPMAKFVSGECLVVDGAEWLNAGQQMSGLTRIPRETLREMMNAMRPKK
ncbi:SDR family oxidoreductase, partial [Bdellovibrionota bacterium]